MKRVMPEMGCVIDGSHMKNIDFQIAVILYASSRGFEMDSGQFQDDMIWLAGYENGDHDDEAILLDIYDALDWTYEDALEYLNSITPADYFYLVEDQSLFLEMTND